MKTSSTSTIAVMQGCPDILFLQGFLKSCCFSDIFFASRPKPGKDEKPQAYLHHFLENLNNHTFGLAFTIACGRRILGIPSNLEEARKMLQLLSGRRHQIWVSFGLKLPDKLKIKTLMTRVSFKVLTSYEIDKYLETEGWKEISGGYSFKDPNACKFIKSINGPPGLLSGIPLYEFDCFMQMYNR